MCAALTTIVYGSTLMVISNINCLLKWLLAMAILLLVLGTHKYMYNCSVVQKSHWKGKLKLMEQKVPLIFRLSLPVWDSHSRVIIATVIRILLWF